MKTIEEAQKYIESSPFDEWIGMKVTEYAKGFCALELTVRPEQKNRWNIVHRGILFSLCGTATALASGYDRESGSVARSAGVYFFRPARGEKLRVEDG